MNKKIFNDKMVTIDPTMNERIPKDDPFVLAKVQKAREIIQKAGLPKEFTEKNRRENTK